MFYRYTFLTFSLLFVCHFHLPSYACVVNCTDKPVFTPSRLVVKHGDPTSATCSVCQSDCKGSAFGLEHSVGKREENGATISWKTDNMTEWGTELMCYYTDDVTDVQCCSKLPVTVYKPPDSLSFSIDDHTGPMFEGHQYTLLCKVHNVAPLKNLTVTFYRGKTRLDQQQLINNIQNKPVTEIYSLTITPSKEDDGAQYRCEAELELGPEGPQPPPVMKSQNITITVHYKPRLEASTSHNSNKITLTEGETLDLNCSAVGNPTPSYTWTLPSDNLPHHVLNNVLTIKSVATEHKGTYNCSAGNTLGNVIVTFNVEVHANYIPYIIFGVVLLLVLVLVCAFLVYFPYYKRNRMGQYNMKDVFRLQKHLIPVYNP